MNWSSGGIVTLTGPFPNATPTEWPATEPPTLTTLLAGSPVNAFVPRMMICVTTTVPSGGNRLRSSSIWLGSFQNTAGFPVPDVSVP
jgi:hypothetical protein